MKHLDKKRQNLMLHVLLSERWNVIFVLIYSILMVYLCIYRCIRYGDNGQLWWFQSLLSCSELYSSFLLSILLFDVIRIGRYKDNHKLEGIEGLKSLVFDKIYFNMGYMTLMSIILFPIMYHYHFQILLFIAVYVFCIGCCNLCLIPLIISREIQTGSKPQYQRHKFLFYVLPLLMVVSLVLFITILDETLGDIHVDISAHILLILGAVSILFHRIIVPLIISMYEDKI